MVTPWRATVCLAILGGFVAWALEEDEDPFRIFERGSP